MRFDYDAGEKMRLESADRPSRSLRVARAETLAQRALGLMGAALDALPGDGAVLFDRCRCVHTFGMAGPISLVWVGPAGPDGSRPVISVDASIPPLRVIAGPRGAAGVLEMHAQDPGVETALPSILSREGQS